MNAPLVKLWQSRHRGVVAAAGAIVGVALVLTLGALGWAIALLHTSATDLEIERQGLAGVELVARDLASLEAELPRRERQLRALLAGGFLEAADRVTWAEAVVGRAEALRPLSYSVAIGAPQWLPLPQSVVERHEGQGVDTQGLHATDLVLRVDGLHEEEILRVIDEALSAGGGVTRIEQCRLARRADAVGLDVECTLRRFGFGTLPGVTETGISEPAS